MTTRDEAADKNRENRSENREADARTEVEAVRTQAEGRAPTYVSTGVISREQGPVDLGWATHIQDPTTKRRTVIKAPQLTPEEQAQAAAALRGALEAGQVKYPQLANTLLRDPSRLWILGEIQMMLSPEENPVSYDLTADLMEGLTTTTGQRLEYEHETAYNNTQQLFWRELGEKFEQQEREFMIGSLAQLTPEGADRVAAQALAWKDTYGQDMDDEETKAQLFLNVATWAASEQGYEQGQEGFFGLIDSLQEIAEGVVSPLINAGVGLISGPEEAARRKGLSLGQQVAYQMGIKPPEQAGDFGWWSFTSGLVDAVAEVGLDPLAWIAGLGAGVKAVKTIPVAMDATKAGRIAAAARAILPKPFSGVPSQVRGGRFARVTYALGNQTVDELLKKALRNGVMDDAFQLVQSGNISRFQRLYPAWKGLSDDTIRVIQETATSPEEMVEVLKSAALDEVRRSGRNLDDLTRTTHQSEQALRQAAGEVGPEVDLVQRVIDNPDDFVYHATDKAENILRKELKAGGLYADRNAAEAFVRHADQAEKPRRVLVFAKDKLPPSVRGPIDRAGEVGDVRGVPNLKPIGSYDPEKGVESFTLLSGTGKRNFNELLMDQNIPRDLRLQAAKDRLSLNAWNMKSGATFILSEVPQRSKRIFNWQNVLDIKGAGRVASGVRRTAARVTPGRIPNSIELFRTRQGVDDLRRLGEHFGLEQGVIDDLVGEFQGLEMGARQEWVWDTFLRRLGRETGVPAFENELVQFYKGGGVRNFSASGVDLLDDGKRIPMLPTQMSNSMPLPVDVLTQVFTRARSITSRSKMARAMGFNGRGLGATKARRSQLVRRLRHQLGEQAEGMSDDQLYDMAYSLVSPNSGLDGRGLWAGKMLPKAGSWGGQLHSWFTKSMLVFRPIQWMWRVALLEEPIRAHLFNMPSLYTNPLQYMARARESHYIWNAQKWAQANMSWSQDVLGVLTKGTKEQMIERVTGLGMANDIFGNATPDTARGVRQAIESFVQNAVYGRTRPNKLNPIKRVPWAVKNRAHSLKTAERAMKKLDLPDDFVFQDEAREISQRLVSGYLGEAVGASDRKLYQWSSGMAEAEAFTHGRVWGAKLIEFVEDPFGRKALQRRAAILRGDIPDVTGHDLVNSSRWQLMAPDLRQKYPGLDDVTVAERYMDDMLGDEIDHLFDTFADGHSLDEVADILDEFATSRRITATVGGEAIDWDLRSANFGGGVRQVGDFTAAARHNNQVRIPSNLPSPSLDGRFMAEDDPGIPARMANWVLQTFGENATQTINRRPAWLHEYKRWYDNYTNLNVPAELAERLAIDNANKMVNHVFFNMDEAPYYVARLNKILPFFGATYEVMGTWAYKMPVAVGGSWPGGVGEFTRKFDRLIDGLVNVGLLSREKERDGRTTLTLNLVPPTSDAASEKELGRFLQGAGYAAVNTLDQAVSTILGLEEGLGLRSQGYRLAAGHPLNPQDYGILSFAQADVGFNPATNILVTALAGRIPGATGPRREVIQPGESVADAAERLDIDFEELVRYNRELFVDMEDFGSTDLYNALLSGQVDPEELVLPENSSVNLPGSSLWDSMADTFMPFGEISSPHEFATNFIPGAFRWVMAGLALQNQPSDGFWKDSDLKGIFGGILPPVNQAQAASQLNEAFMYLEAHDLVNGKGPFTRIQEKEQRLQVLLNEGNIEEANALKAELSLDTQAFLDRAQKVAAESLILRGLTGQMLPTTPGHVRLEAEKIREYWDTKDYADNLVGGNGESRLKNFDSMEDYENYQEQLAAWLTDPTGDRARAVFSSNNPQLMAYLTPKTFYKNPVPEVDGYEEYVRQIESGERESSPLHVTMWRARSTAIQSDYYNKFISTFGNDPMEAAAAALQNRQMYSELQDERDLAYQGLEMWDDMHGGVYDTWRDENYQDVETWAQDQINDKLNKVRDNLQILFELEDNLDIEIDLEGIANLNSSVRGAIAEISDAIDQYNALSDRTITRNPYEEAINRYFQEVYIPYSDEISQLYDKLPEVADSERVSLVFEQIKLLKNDLAGTEVYLEGSETPFPNPLEYSWAGKPDEEREVKMQQWLSRPVEWMDLDQADRILDRAPQLQGYLPSQPADFDVYREYTLRKIEVDEMFEVNEITRSQRTKMMDYLETELHKSLIEQGRGNEIIFSQMTPYEKLELSGLLPKNLEYLGDQVRYYKQVLAQAEETPGTVQGRIIVEPILNEIETAFFSDPSIRETMQDLGINLFDDTNLDTFVLRLLFGYSGER